MSKERGPDRIRREVIGGSADAGAAAVGALLGSIGGPLGIAAGAIGGAAATRMFRWMGGELEQRLLAPRQRERIAIAAERAALEIERRTNEGEAVREDGFFNEPDPEHSAGAELLEGVLLHAANAYQEKKAPYLGNLFASTTFRPDVTPAEAHMLLTMAERVSYRQFCALAFFAAHAHEESLMLLDVKRDEEGHKPFARGLAQELDELGEMGLLGVRPPGSEPAAKPGQLWGGGDFSRLDLAAVELLPTGQLLYELLGLESIPNEDQVDIRDALEGR